MLQEASIMATATANPPRVSHRRLFVRSIIAPAGSGDDVLGKKNAARNE